MYLITFETGLLRKNKFCGIQNQFMCSSVFVFKFILIQISMLPYNRIAESGMFDITPCVLPDK